MQNISLNFGSQDVPVDVLKLGSQRFLRYAGMDGINNDHFDQRLAQIFVRYGGAEVSKIVERSRSLGMTQSRFDNAQFMMMLDKLVVPSYSNNLKGLDSYERAKEIVRKSLQNTIGSLKPLEISSVQDLMDHLPKMEASAGYLGLVTGKGKKGQNLEDILEVMRFKLGDLSNVDYSPIVFSYRTNIKSILNENRDLNDKWDVKTRAISMVSAEDAAIEMLTAQPFMDGFCRSHWYAGGKDGEALTRAIRGYRDMYTNWTSIDYSSYDITIPLWLIKDAFDVIFSLFGDSISEEYKDFIIRGFCSARMIYPGGKIERKRIGVPSGSYFTQAIDSVVNAIIINHYYIHRSGGKFHMLIMGDDNLIFSNKELHLEDLSYFLKSRYGIICNPEKCSAGRTHPYWEQHPEFLSRQWMNEGAYRDLKEVVVKGINPERWRDYSKDGMDAALIFYALSFVYPETFRLHFNMNQFRKDYPRLSLSVNFSQNVVEGLPGSVMYKLVYLDHNTFYQHKKLKYRGSDIPNAFDGKSSS